MFYRWYAGVAIHFIHRRRAIAIWKKLSSGQEVTLETALGCFELFNLKTAEGDPDDTARILDELAARFQSQTPNLHQLSTKAKASALCGFMNREGFRGASSERYRALKNSFIGISLRTDRTNLPLTATAIFCSLATRIGLSAFPCGFPYHVLAIVKNEESGQYIYLDPFRGDGNELPLAGLENQLQMLGVGEAKEEYLRPSATSEIVLRTARNILESLRHTASTNREPTALVDRNSALYAALMASVLLGPRVTFNLIQHMSRLIQDDMAMDVLFFEEDIIPAVDFENCRELMEETCSALRGVDSHPKPVNERSKEEEVKVGHFFITARCHTLDLLTFLLVSRGDCIYTQAVPIPGRHFWLDTDMYTRRRGGVDSTDGGRWSASRKAATILSRFVRHYIILFMCV